MLTRRKLVGGLIAAPAIIRPAHAWTHGNAGGGAGAIIGNELLLPNMTQVKPNGIPQINWSHPLTKGLLVDMFDLGNGQYINFCEGNEPYNQYYGSDAGPGSCQAPPGPIALVNGVTGYGAATLWPGLTVGGECAKPGPAAIIQVNLGDLAIANATDLASKGIGAGNTLSCALMRLPGTIPNIMSWIFGRTGVSAGELNPSVTWAFSQPGGTNSILAQCIDSVSGSQVQVGSTYSCPDNQFTMLHMTCQNTSASPGTGPAVFSVNGVDQGSPTSVSMFSYNPMSFAETDLMMGANKHMQTSETANFWGGYLFVGRVRTRALNRMERMYEFLYPWSIYL